MGRGLPTDPVVARMSNTWDEMMTPRPPCETKLELAHSLWTPAKPQRSVAAAIYVTAAGREWRVSYGTPDNLLDSLLSRTDDGPLEARAADVRAVLEESAGG
jgi:hypothetical protein